MCVGPEIANKTPRMIQRPHLPALTSLRFVAAFAVVLYHFAVGASAHWPLFWRNLVGNGSAGVPFFFILSGFVLTYTYQGSSVTNGRFWWLRFARIYPVYLVSLLLALPPYLALLRQGEGFGGFPLDIVTRTLLLQQWLPGQALRWNGPAWTLSCEAFFYLSFPLALFAMVRLKRGHLWVSGAAILLYALFGPVARATGSASFEALSHTPLRHVFLFVAGIGLALEFLQGYRLPAGLFWLSSAAAVLVMGFIPTLDGIWGLCGCLTFAVLILSAASLELKGVAKALSWAPLVLLGEASYSLYILHEPLGSYLHLVAKKTGLSFDSTWVVIGASLFAVAVSIVAFKLVERPANGILRRWCQAGARVAAPVPGN